MAAPVQTLEPTELDSSFAVALNGRSKNRSVETRWSVRGVGDRNQRAF